MKLFDSTTKIIDKTKIYFYLLYTFTTSKSFSYLLNVKPSNSVFFKSCNTEFTDQNGGALEIEDKVNLTLLIKKQKWSDILQNQEQKNMLKDRNFDHS